MRTKNNTVLALSFLVTRPPDTTVHAAFNSAIHKATVRPAAVQNDLRRSFLPAAPIDSQWTFFCSTGIVPGKAGNGSAGGFVNSAVRPRNLTSEQDGGSCCDGPDMS